ncbi:3-dehydroquinate synthase [Flavobacterium sp.]|uniref:3-dehydroquinate synthase n=1 Tax=Flavobacterium sp. TaxID=239 RepID=UPI001B63C359|nr:3-dehydroquinate synthase [Flavobacterium sp.]MBP6128484.1 3-dehydroquinate synthase [Flavobacterium sp.]
MTPIQSDNYTIYFNDASFVYLENLLKTETYSKIFVLVDENTNEHCLPYFLANLPTEIEIEIIEIEAGEENKNIYTCIDLWHTLIELDADRKSIMINLGGGIITDIGGFVASTYKRGIDFVNIPTTLLAMVDASVGGKTGVDLGSLKNQIGIINEPKSVIVISKFLETLPTNQMRSGLAEMLKHGLIYDKTYWDKLKHLNNLNTDDLDVLIKQSIEIKNKIVSQDLKENGIRKALNFGHSLGHAIESYCLESEDKNQLLHGEAIAIGMILESYLSYKLEFISKDSYAEIKYIITDVFEKISFNDSDIQKILDLLIFDKKNEFGNIQFTLLNKIGESKINQTVDKSLILLAFEDYLKN